MFVAKTHNKLIIDKLVEIWYIIDNIHKNNPKIDPNESEENIINEYKEHVIESINKVNPSVVDRDINDYSWYLIRRFNKNEFCTANQNSSNVYAWRDQ